MRACAHPPAAAIDLASVLYVLGDPARLAIVRALAVRGGLSCAATEFGLPKSTLSHHFSVLRRAGLIRSRRQGTTHLLSRARQAEIDRRFPGLLACVLVAEPPGRKPGRKPRVARSGRAKP